MEKVEDLNKKGEYKRSISTKIAIILALIVILVVLTLISIYVSGRDISFFSCIEYLLNHINGEKYDLHSSEWWDDHIVWNLRLPRALLAIIGGAGLAVGGATMQGVMKNPLADPYTAGISSATLLGVAIAMVMGYSLTSGTGQYGVVLNAFVFGLIPVGLILIMSKSLDPSPSSLILFGVIMSSMFSALSTLVMVTADDQTLQSVYSWQVGTLYDTQWSDLPLPLVFTTICSALITISSKKMNLLMLGDESAHSLGLNVENYRIVILVLVSLMTASIVCFTGVLGFIGLVVPHLVRIIFGSDNKFLIPLSAMFGAIFLLFADIVSKLIISPEEMQVGVVLAFIGAPIFLYVIIRSKRQVW